jgi:hypothetical protein
MKNTIQINRGKTLPAIYTIGFSSDFAKSIIIESFEGIDIDLPITFGWGNTDQTAKMITLLDSAQEAITLTVDKTTRRAGIMLKDVVCPYLFVKINLPEGVILPTASTLASSALTEISATLSASVNPRGSLTNVIFEYGIGNAFNNSASATDVPIGSAATRQKTVTGLTPGTEYNARVKMISSAGTSYSDEFTFTTVTPLAPTIDDEAVVEASDSAAISASVDTNGHDTTVTIEYGLTTAYGSSVAAEESPIDAAVDPVDISADIIDLEPETTYHWRVVATNSVGTTNGDDQKLTTEAEA